MKLALALSFLSFVATGDGFINSIYRAIFENDGHAEEQETPDEGVSFVFGEYYYRADISGILVISNRIRLNMHYSPVHLHMKQKSTNR